MEEHDDFFAHLNEVTVTAGEPISVLNAGWNQSQPSDPSSSHLQYPQQRSEPMMGQPMFPQQGYGHNHQPQYDGSGLFVNAQQHTYAQAAGDVAPQQPSGSHQPATQPTAADSEWSFLDDLLTSHDGAGSRPPAVDGYEAQSGAAAFGRCDTGGSSWMSDGQVAGSSGYFPPLPSHVAGAGASAAPPTSQPADEAASADPGEAEQSRLARPSTYTARPRRPYRYPATCVTRIITAEELKKENLMKAHGRAVRLSTQSPESAFERLNLVKRNLAGGDYVIDERLGITWVQSKKEKGKRGRPSAAERQKQSQKLERELPTTLDGYNLSGIPRDFQDNHCYCDSPRNFALPEFLCRKCSTWFHQGCTSQSGQAWMIPFMINYDFVCAFCSETGREEFELKPGKYLHFCVTALANLRHSSILVGHPREFFARTQEIIQFIGANWKAVSGGLPEKESKSWHHTVSREMIRNPAVFHVLRDSSPLQLPKRGFPKFALVGRDPRIIRPVYTGRRSKAHYGDFMQSEMRLLSLLELPLPESYRMLASLTQTPHFYRPVVPRNRSGKPAHRVARIPDPPAQNQASGQEQGAQVGFQGHLQQVKPEPVGTQNRPEVWQQQEQGSYQPQASASTTG